MHTSQKVLRLGRYEALRWVSAACMLASLVIALAPSARGQTSPEASLQIEAEVGGTKLVEGSETPVKVIASEPTRIRIVVRNVGSTPREMSGVRFDGKVIGIPVFRCDVLAPVIVPPGESIERSFEIEPACLRDQATGLVPASLTVNGPQQTPLKRWPLVLDIKGSLKSIYGLSGIFIVMVTFFALASLLAALVRQRLPRNRFSRALRFTTVGTGIGFSLVFVLASAAVMVPDAENWIPVVAIPALVFTVGGYLSPTPQRERDAVAPPADATQVLPQPWPSSERTDTLPQAAQTYPDPAQGAPPPADTTPASHSTPSQLGGVGHPAHPGASTASARGGTNLAGTPTSEIPSRSIPTKKVRPVSSRQDSDDRTGNDISDEIQGGEA